MTTCLHHSLLQARCADFLLRCLLLPRRRNERARNFLALLRQSQLFEVFVRERLEMFATVQGGAAFSSECAAQQQLTWRAAARHMAAQSAHGHVCWCCQGMQS